MHLFKVKLNNQLRILELGEDLPSISSLESIVRDRFGIEDKAARLHLSYCDSDGDSIELTETEELCLALRTQKQPLRITAVELLASAGRQPGAIEVPIPEATLTREEREAMEHPGNAPVFLHSCASLEADTITRISLSPSELRDTLRFLRLRPQLLVRRGLAPPGSLSGRIAVDSGAKSEVREPSRTLGDKNSDHELEADMENSESGLGNVVASIFLREGINIEGRRALRLLRILGCGPRRLVRMGLLPVLEFRQLCRDQRIANRAGQRQGGRCARPHRGRGGRGGRGGSGRNREQLQRNTAVPTGSSLLSGSTGKASFHVLSTEIGSQSPSLILCQEFKVIWVIVNNGSTTWPDKLQMFCEQGGWKGMEVSPGRGTPVASGARPQESVVIVRHFKAPSTPGRFSTLFQLREVHNTGALVLEGKLSLNLSTVEDDPRQPI